MMEDGMKGDDMMGDDMMDDDDADAMDGLTYSYDLAFRTKPQ